MTTRLTATEIANRINAAGEKYYNDIARGWIGTNESRIYFGRDYVALTATGEITNTKGARSKTIGDSAVALVEKYAA